MRVALATVALIILTGCGGEDPHASYVDQANAICKRYEGRIAALGRPTSIRELELFLERAEPLIRRQLRELRALDPAEEDRAEARALVENMELALEHLPKARAAARRGDRAAARAAIERFSTRAEDARAAAGELGARECAGA